MISTRKSQERGHANHGWLDSRHSFSFANYYDPNYMGFSALRVINEDVVAPGTGFGMHPHRDMEIVTYVLSGALRHADSLGTGEVITAGEVQRMTAGTGIRHSEFNDSQTEAVHLLQIWIEPDRLNLEPGYEQKRIPDADKRGVWKAIATPDGRDGSLTIHQQASLYATVLGQGDSLDYASAADRVQYLHVVRGEVQLNGGTVLADGDSVSVTDGEELSLTARGEVEVLLFDLPAAYPITKN